MFLFLLLLLRCCAVLVLPDERLFFLPGPETLISRMDLGEAVSESAVLLRGISPEDIEEERTLSPAEVLLVSKWLLAAREPDSADLLFSGDLLVVLEGVPAVLRPGDDALAAVLPSERPAEKLLSERRARCSEELLLPERPLCLAGVPVLPVPREALFDLADLALRAEFSV